MTRFTRRYMSVSELCAELECSRKTIYRIIQADSRCAWMTPGAGKYIVDTDVLAEILRQRAAAPRVPRQRRKHPPGITCEALMADMPDVAEGDDGGQTADPVAAAAI